MLRKTCTSFKQKQADLLLAAPPVCFVPPSTAWDAFVSGAEPNVLASGEAAVPDAAVVYQIALRDPLVLVPVDVATASVYAVFLEHGTGELTTALASPSGVILVAAAEEGAAGEEEEDEHEREDDSTTATHWAHALGATFAISACR